MHNCMKCYVTFYFRIESMSHVQVVPLSLRMKDKTYYVAKRALKRHIYF